MRTSFVQTLAEIAAADERTVLLTADLGFMALEPFSDRFPDRFFNVGVSEQNMIGLATGLAEAGYRPYCYSIAPFASLRPLEFIRNGAVLHHLPVRIVGVGGGFEYGAAGPTHHGIDDIGTLRVMNDLTLVAPADAAQTASVVRAIHTIPGPAYLRIGKDDKRRVEGLDGAFELGRAQVVREGHDVALITMGSIASEVEAAAILLAERGVHCTVVVVASLTPAPIGDLQRILGQHRLAMTVEAHSIVGGVGSLVSEIAAEAETSCRVVRRGVTGHSTGRTGSEAYYHSVHGIDRQAIVESVLTELKVQPS
ncbi:transketolase subunit B [Frankineae bacterium MT45]|nr:transketolase subunit B [Frankineae bacterium MT45]